MAGTLEDACQSFALRETERGRGLVLQLAATTQLLVRDFWIISLSHLDGIGDVSGIYFRMRTMITGRIDAPLEDA